MQGSAPRRTPELRSELLRAALWQPRPVLLQRPLFSSSSRRAGLLLGLAGKRTRGRAPLVQYKSRFSGLYLTRCSNFCERQRERAGGPGRVEQPALGRGERSGARGSFAFGQYPDRSGDHHPPATPLPASPRQVSGTWATAADGHFALGPTADGPGVAAPPAGDPFRGPFL